MADIRIYVLFPPWPFRCKLDYVAVGMAEEN